MKALVKTQSGVSCQVVAGAALRSEREVCIRVSCAAICRTDVFAARGVIPVKEGRVLGHEFTGVITQVGHEVREFEPGMRVVVNPLLVCGECADCAAGKSQDCVEAGFLGLDEDGAFAQEVAVDAGRVHALPESVSDAVGTYAEPLAATLAVLRADLPKEERIAVTGSGRIAELTRLILTDHGYEAVAAKDGAGEHAAVVETDLCSANVEATLRLLRPGGLLVMKSRLPAPVALPPLLCVRRRVQVQCVHYADFAQALRYLEAHAARLESFLGSAWPLEQHAEAFAAAEADEALKILFKPNS